MIETSPSPLQRICFREKNYFIKRDDLLDKHFSGNKARKFHYLLRQSLPHIDTIVSYGSPQSNAMYSLSVLAKMRGWKFIYYVDHIASYLQENPHGSYLGCIQNGASIMIGKPPVHYHDNVLYVPEGGAMREAEQGIALLAKEINSDFRGKNIDIFLPSGTGTTALYLQKHTDFKVYTTPCVGNREYLVDQFTNLEQDRDNHPIILDTSKKFHFGKLYREFLEIWIELKQETGIEFDLLYDPKGWYTLLTHESEFENDILYIHQGGVLGNESMLKRYGRKFHEYFRK